MNIDENSNHGTLGSYIMGFAISIILTLIPYTLVVNHALGRNGLVWTIALCALIQLIVQLKYFLHLNFSPKFKDSLLSFIFTIVTLIVIVFGSMWIMHDLNYFMMDPIMDTNHTQNKE